MDAPEPTPRYHGREELPEEDGRPVFFRGLTRTDWVLFVITAPLSLFILQFATNSIVQWLDRPRNRRGLMALLVLLEAAFLVGAVLYVRHSIAS